MPRRNSQERHRWPFRFAAVLLPVAKRMNADPQGSSEVLLRHLDKVADCHDIITALDDSLENPLALLAGNRALNPLRSTRESLQPFFPRQ